MYSYILADDYTTHALPSQNTLHTCINNSSLHVLYINCISSRIIFCFFKSCTDCFFFHIKNIKLAKCYMFLIVNRSCEKTNSINEVFPSKSYQTHVDGSTFTLGAMVLHYHENPQCSSCCLHHTILVLTQ